MISFGNIQFETEYSLTDSENNSPRDKMMSTVVFLFIGGHYFQVMSF